MCSLICAINRNAKSPVRVAPVSAEPAGFGELLAKQEVQAVFSTGKIPDPRFSSETLFREEFVAVFYRNHPLADADLSYAGLSGEPVIWLRRDFEPWLHANFLNACAARGYQPVIRQEVTTFQECLHFVHESMGITFLPASIRLECRDDAIVSAILPGGGLYIESSLLYREDSPSAGLDYFARFMRKYVIEQGPLYSLDSLVTR
jgi:DNA-binding transcriptional LysR family regulator